MKIRHRSAVYEDGYEPQAISIVIVYRDHRDAGDGLLGKEANAHIASHAAARRAGYANGRTGSVSYRHAGSNESCRNCRSNRCK